MLYTQHAALALVATALVLSGCGGSSKSQSASSSAQTSATTATTGSAPSAKLTRVELIAKAEPICAHTNAELRATGGKSISELERALPQAAAYDLAEAIDLGKLTPPSSMANDWKTIVSGVRANSEAVATEAKYIASNNTAAETTLYATTKAQQNRVLAIAKRDGFSACATG